MGCGNFKVSYSKDMAIFQTKWIRNWIIGFIVFLIIFPFTASPYLIYIVNITAIAVIGSLGLNIITGYCGQISFGQAAFLAIGAYTSAILSAKVGLSFWMAMPLSGLITAFAGLIVGIPSLRLKGLYLVMTTLALVFICQFLVINWESMTGGSGGRSVPLPTLFSYTIRSDLSFYFLIMPITVLAVLFAKNLARTKPGRAFVAIRDRYMAAEIIGVNIARFKILAFFISSFYVGIAGSLYAHYTREISPEHFPITLSIDYIAMIIIGGMGSILGSIYGAAFVTMLPEGIRMFSDLFRGSAPFLTERILELKAIVFGLIIILFLIFEPDGINGRWQKIKIYWKKWPYKYR